MKYIYNVLLSVFIFLMVSNNLTSQSISWNYLESLTTDMYSDSSQSNDGVWVLNTHEYKELSGVLTDTSDIASIRLKIGNSAGGSNILLKTFAFSGQSYDQHIWFNRVGSLCRFGLGEFINREQAFLTIETLDSGGGVTSTNSSILY